MRVWENSLLSKGRAGVLVACASDMIRMWVSRPFITWRTCWYECSCRPRPDTSRAADKQRKLCDGLARLDNAAFSSIKFTCATIYGQTQLADNMTAAQHAGQHAACSTDMSQRVDHNIRYRNISRFYTIIQHAVLQAPGGLCVGRLILFACKHS